MRVSPDCYQCLERLAYQTLRLATTDAELKSKAAAKALEIIERNFGMGKIPSEIASEMQRLIRKMTANPDPYRQTKDRELEIGEQLCHQALPHYGDNLRSRVKLSALGNAIDFFRDLDEVKRHIESPVAFALDDVDRLEEKLKGAKKILFLADNAGECFFDFPLLKMMEKNAEVIYVVKGSPVQDDVTIEDLRRAGLADRINQVMTTGTDTPGIDFSLASTEFKREFEMADVIFAKGMGYYETLDELPPGGKIFFCLMAKCKPIASSLGVPVNSYIAMLQ